MAEDSQYYEEDDLSKMWNPMENAPDSSYREGGNKPPEGLGKDSPQDGSVRVERGLVFDMPFIEIPGKRHITKFTECYLVIFDHFVRYKIRAEYELLDEELQVMVPKKANYRWARMRKDITDVSMYYDNVDRAWAVGLEFSGKNETVWLFERGEDAKKVYDVLENYFITRDQLPLVPVVRPGKDA